MDHELSLKEDLKMERRWEAKVMVFETNGGKNL